MRAGVYRHRIRFERAVEGSGPTGQPREQWEAIATSPEVWASIEAVDGREELAGGGIQATAGFRIRTRFRDDVTPKERIVDVATGKIHDIQSIADRDGRRREIEIRTVADG